MSKAKRESIPAIDDALDRACESIFQTWLRFLPESAAREQSENFRQLVTSANPDINALREYKIAGQLESLGLRLQKSPGGTGFRIYGDGNQILAGRDFSLSLKNVIDFCRGVGLTS